MGNAEDLVTSNVWLIEQASLLLPCSRVKKGWSLDENLARSIFHDVDLLVTPVGSLFRSGGGHIFLGLCNPIANPRHPHCKHCCEQREAQAKSI